MAMSKFILEYNSHRNSRCQDLVENEFLDIFFRECSNFSFDNDQLWRSKDKVGLQLFKESRRRGTIGNYSYKDFFDMRQEYPVPRYKSLIGSTTTEGAEYFGYGGMGKIALVIPFNNANIVFAPVPDIAIMSRVKAKFSDDLFIMKQYEKGFKVPSEDLFEIMCSLPGTISTNKQVLNKGYEFFTNSGCLILPKDKIDWLKGVLEC